MSLPTEQLLNIYISLVQNPEESFRFWPDLFPHQDRPICFERFEKGEVMIQKIDWKLAKTLIRREVIQLLAEKLDDLEE